MGSTSYNYGIVEELGSVIGYSATAALVDWFGGGDLWVPTEADEENPIAKVIGMPAMRKLVTWMDQQSDVTTRRRFVSIPLGYQLEQNRRDRMIAVLLHLGLGSKQVGNLAGMSQRQVQYIRQRVEAMGLLPLILRKAGVKTLEESRGRKRGN